MEILVLGGTGAIGNDLVKLLVENGNDVYVTSRRDRNSYNKNLTYIKGNAADDSFLAEILGQGEWDTIVDFMSYSTDAFRRRVDVLLGSTKQYLFFSSSRVYAESAIPLTEESPRLLDLCKEPEYLSTDEYALAKARQEDILKASEKVNWTIIRPYITYSNIRLQLGFQEKELWLYRALQGRTIIFSNDIGERTTTMTGGVLWRKH